MDGAPSPGIGTESTEREVRGNRRSGAGAGAASDTPGVIRVAGLAAGRAAADARRRIFVEVGLAEDDGSGRTQFATMVASLGGLSLA